MSNLHTQRKQDFFGRALLLLFSVSLIFPLRLETAFFNIYPYDPVIFLFAISYFVKIVHRKKIQTSKVELLFYSLPIWITIPWIFTPSHISPLKGGQLWLRAAIIFSVICRGYGKYYSKNDVLIAALVLLTLQGTIALIQGLLQTDVGALNQYFGTKTSLITYRNVGGERVLRAQGTLSNPNLLASWICTLLPFAVVYSTYRKERMYPYGIISIAVVGVYFSGSRGLFALSLLITVITIVVVGMQNENLRFTLVAITLGSVLLMLPLAYLTHLSVTLASVEARINQIQSGLLVFRKSIIIGVGYGNFIESLYSSDIAHFYPGVDTRVHNIMLLLLIETGIIGFSLFALAFMEVVSHAFNLFARHSSHRPFIVGLMMSLICITGISQLYTTLVSFQFLPLAISIIAVIVGANRHLSLKG